jgi:hypothetical protein
MDKALFLQAGTMCINHHGDFIMKKMNLVLGAVLAGAASMAVADSLFVDATGNIGVGTNVPASKLHVLDGNLTVEQSGAGVAGRIEFKTAGGHWQINQNGNTGRLTFVSPAFPGAPFKFQPGAVDNLLRIGVLATDTVDVNGKLVVNNVQIADYVFKEDYALPTIEEQAEFMYKNHHLPAVQKGDKDMKANIDVMGNQMAMLEELEKAHIYITQLNATIKEMKADLDQLKAAK